MAVTEARTNGRHPDFGPVRMPRRWRYLLAVPLLLGGFALVLGMGFGAGQTKSDQAAAFTRVTVPGSVALYVGHPTTYYVYSELTACLDYPDCHGQLYPVSVKVTGPTGNAVRVEPTSGPTYMIGGTEGVGVGRFDATTEGNYRVAASTGPYSQGSIAVGEAFPAWTQDWVAWLVMVLLLAGGTLIIVVPNAVYIRRTRTSSS